MKLFWSLTMLFAGEHWKTHCRSLGSKIPRSIHFSLIVIICITLLQGCQETVQQEPGWPTVGRETKPWTRWWWHGSALTKAGITAEMEAYQQANIGGLEITPIYGVFGNEGQFVNYLSPQWMELFLHTLREAERLDMGIDMATGTGWPFGGPWVNDDDASKNLHHTVHTLHGGERLEERIVFTQQPYLRAVGSQLYEVNDTFSTEKSITQGTRNEPVVRLDRGKIDIARLKQPIADNKNLQALAIDQVVFERLLPLKLLMAYSNTDQVVNLTSKVDETGKLDWVAPDGDWKLYAVFQGWHGKMVERAGPGGEGNVIDHFSAAALQHYLSRFDTAFAGKDIRTLRAFFNDSYEVDDARGAADWTPDLFGEFSRRRGYNLEEHLPALFGNDDPEKNKRVLCDYRETISEMLLHNFTEPWKKWAHGKSAIIRNQAHGSPSNILDLYATVDIPEIEGVEPLRIKMASSAGNVTGKKLVSSESATWLNEHFESNLSDIKVALNRFMLNGVNHIFYHGTTYSPPEEPWPGRLFYAAVHLNPRNALWKDFAALNNYVTRCQSFLQNSTPDNDVLLYYPVYDRFSTPGEEMIEHFDGIGKQFEQSAFGRGAETLYEKGYAFDYISDRQIENTITIDGNLKTESGSLYKTIVIPHCRYIPIETFQKIISLAEEGATVFALEGLPESFSGYGNYEEHENTFQALMKKLEVRKQVAKGVTSIDVGKGKIFVGDSVDVLLLHASIRKEAMVTSGIQFIRKRQRNNSTVYFVLNSNDESFAGWLPLQSGATAAVLYDPMNGKFGGANMRKVGKGITEVYVQLAKRQTLLVETYDDEIDVPSFKYYTIGGAPISLNGKWEITFESGGPVLPLPVEVDTLSSWTTFGETAYQAFSGTASYAVSFSKPDLITSGWMLDLGNVKESAQVFLNGKSLGTLIGPVFQVAFDDSLLQVTNMLEVKVSNLMANRIAEMDKKNIFWKKFYNVNFPAQKRENRKNGLFDASHWQPRDSGLMGPVVLTPVDFGTGSGSMR